MILDGYHHRSIEALKECKWHLCNLSASEAMPVNWDAHRLNVLKRVQLLIDEMESEFELSKQEQP